jgi:hypothetical protein
MPDVMVPPRDVIIVYPFLILLTNPLSAAGTKAAVESKEVGSVCEESRKRKQIDTTENEKDKASVTKKVKAGTEDGTEEVKYLEDVEIAAHIHKHVRGLLCAFTVSGQGLIAVLRTILDGNMQCSRGSSKPHSNAVSNPKPFFRYVVHLLFQLDD